MIKIMKHSEKEVGTAFGNVFFFWRGAEGGLRGKHSYTH